MGPKASLGLSAAVFAAAIGLLIAIEAWLWPIKGLWADELWSLWATNPQGGFLGNLRWRILADPNPPLYAMALQVFRRLFHEPRTALVALNVASLVAGVAVVLATSWRRAPRLGLLSCAAFLLSGPVVAYTLEGRHYALPMAVVFAAAWLSAWMLRAGVTRTGVGALALAGLLASGTHVFAGFMTGSLGVGFALYALAGRRRDLWASAVALCFSSGLVLAAFAVMAASHTGEMSWVIFDVPSVVEALKFVSDLQFGPLLGVLLFAGFLAVCVAARRGLDLIAVFGAAIVLFVVAPIAISFVVPVIVGRYWMVGAPAIGVLAAFLIRDLWIQPTPDRLRNVATLLALAAWAIGAAAGPFAARKVLLDEMVWAGPTVARLAQACPAGSINVRPPFGSPFIELYPTAAGLPSATFRAIAAGTPPTLRTPAPCPVLGWAEHVDWMLLKPLSDAQLAAMVAVGGEPARDFRVVRRPSGFLVLAPDARP